MATTSTTTNTTPALFRFSIHTTTTTTYISHTHPVPLFLCHPTPPQQTTPAFTDAFLDVLSLITAQHHAECMTALLPSPCLACSAPASDCLKAPASFLNLAEPLVVINVYPVCGNKPCEVRVRERLARHQVRENEVARVQERAMFGKMVCGVCRKEDAKRCAGCGTVAYCGKVCQAQGWKAHKKDCGRSWRKKKEMEAVGLPYETI